MYIYIEVYLELRRFELSHSRLYVVCQKIYVEIKIKFKLFYLTLRLSVTNI